MEESPVTIDDQQRTRIAAFLSIEAEDLSRLLEQLQHGDHAKAALTKLVQQLNEKAMQSSEESWKEVAEEAKAALATEKINFGKKQRLFFFFLMQPCRRRFDSWQPTACMPTHRDTHGVLELIPR